MFPRVKREASLDPLAFNVTPPVIPSMPTKRSRIGLAGLYDYLRWLEGEGTHARLAGLVGPLLEDKTAAFRHCRPGKGSALLTCVTFVLVVPVDMHGLYVEIPDFGGAGRRTAQIPMPSGSPINNAAIPLHADLPDDQRHEPAGCLA